MPLRFQFRRYRLPFRAPVRTAHGPWTEREGVLVRLEDAAGGETGGVGFGEAAPIPWFGTETVDEVEAGCRALGEWIEDSALESVPANLGCLRHALASALGERQASAPGDGESRSAAPARVRPVYLPVAALLPAGRAALAQIAPKAEVGFRVFKWKVGVGDLADELTLLDDVCAELPTGAKLRLDANGAWDRRRAERWLERCADRPVEFVEQPCFSAAAQGETLQRRTDDILLGLAGDYPTPIALDESITGAGDLERWIGVGWPGIFVVKPSLLDDVRAALRRLEGANARVVFSSALETAVGAKSALQAAFAWPGELVPKVAESGRAAAPESPPAHRASSDAGPESRRRARALGFGVWPLFADARFDGPAAAPFVRYDDVAAIDADAVWNALS